MLESMRRQGASIFIYLIFGTLIAVFVINFGPQGGGKGGGGCSGTDNVIVSVDGHDASQTAFHVAYSNPYNRGQGKQRVYVALETIIRRELLASEAESRGLLATDDLILDQIKKGHFFIGGYKVAIPSALEDIDGEKFYNHKAVKSWVGQLNVSLNSYYEEQKRSLLASMMSDILQDSVQVSREEALSQFLYEGNTVQYDVVGFKPETYRSALRVTDADVERFLASNEDAVKARYKADERTYKAVKPQLELREIFIAKAEPKPSGDAKPDDDNKPADDKPPTDDKAPADQKATDKPSDKGDKATDKKDSAKVGDKQVGDNDKKVADNDKKVADKKGDKKGDKKVADKKDDKKVADKKPADKKLAVKAVGMPIEQAKAKLEAARESIIAGKQKFSDAARELATDESLKSTGGDLGWRTADNASIGDKAVTDAIKALKPGEMTPVITTDRGAYLVMAQAKREGDLTYDQVKLELAKELARDTWSKEAAKRAAIAALDEAHAGTGKNLQQLYERELLPENPGQNFQNMSPEEQERLLEQLKQQMGAQHGSIEFETKDVPAAWYADSGEPTGGVAPAAGSSATGSATGPATGAAAGSVPATAPAAATGAAAPSPTEVLTPSKDQLPQLGEVPKAKVNSFGPAPRTAQLPGIGPAKDLADALFDELTPGMLAKRIYGANGSYYVVQLISKQSPKVEDFDKNADQRVSELRDGRAQAFMKDWLKDRCDKLAKDGKIKPNHELIQERDDQGKPLPIAYKPCMSF